MSELIFIRISIDISLSVWASSSSRKDKRHRASCPANVFRDNTLDDHIDEGGISGRRSPHLAYSIAFFSLFILSLLSKASVSPLICSYKFSSTCVSKIQSRALYPDMLSHCSESSAFEKQQFEHPSQVATSSVIKFLATLLVTPASFRSSPHFAAPVFTRITHIAHVADQDRRTRAIKHGERERRERSSGDLKLHWQHGSPFGFSIYLYHDHTSSVSSHLRDSLSPWTMDRLSGCAEIFPLLLVP